MPYFHLCKTETIRTQKPLRSVQIQNMIQNASSDRWFRQQRSLLCWFLWMPRNTLHFIPNTFQNSYSDPHGPERPSSIPSAKTGCVSRVLKSRTGVFGSRTGTRCLSRYGRRTLPLLRSLWKPSSWSQYVVTTLIIPAMLMSPGWCWWGTEKPPTGFCHLHGWLLSSPLLLFSNVKLFHSELT